MNIPISRTVFSQQDLDIILLPLKSGWVVQGKYVKEFEEKWSNFTSAKFSVAVTNCTTALQLCLSALKVGFKDEVILPSFTWVATANSIESVGAKPIFCDIELESFNIDHTRIEELITPATKAIIPVHLFGVAANMNEIIRITNRHNLSLIEDSACGFATKYKKKHVGNCGIAGCFSFHPRKAITTGEGGMITTNDEELSMVLRAMRDHGARTSDLEKKSGKKPYLLPDFPYFGYNFRLTDIQASIGSSQMDYADEIYHKRLRIAEKYDSLINSIEWLKKQFNDNGNQHGYQSYVCLFRPEEVTIDNIPLINKMRNDFMDYLSKNGIMTRPGTHAVHTLEYYKRKYKYKQIEYPNSWIADKCSIAFPLFPSLSDEEFDYIAEKISGYKFH